MTEKPKKTKAEEAAQHCGMTVEQWQNAKAQTAADRGRGRRPAGTAGAEAKLAGWGAVEDQIQLFAGDGHSGSVS
jgi:hypothetical protein